MGDRKLCLSYSSAVNSIKHEFDGTWDTFELIETCAKDVLSYLLA